ncbi:hypothetical protein RRG08_003749 [Elysia crispata]|uniref:Uncharacterized protein n=1 Tax=Elysia crispata TaxID=231223 RepID=A0AAE1AWE5_9GAST|nr:hypothetical protein RRG08_003749 [Elysia crispata]
MAAGLASPGVPQWVKHLPHSSELYFLAVFCFQQLLDTSAQAIELIAAIISIALMRCAAVISSLIPSSPGSIPHAWSLNQADILQTVVQSYTARQKAEPSLLAKWMIQSTKISVKSTDILDHVLMRAGKCLKVKNQSNPTKAPAESLSVGLCYSLTPWLCCSCRPPPRGPLRRGETVELSHSQEHLWCRSQRLASPDLLETLA